MDFPASVCEQDLAAPAARSGTAGRAMLLYDCLGEACTGSERFASGVRHAIAVEVDADPDAVLELESSNPQVARIFDVASTYDPCANKLKAWATLEALEPGQLELRVRDARETIDAVSLEVAIPAAIRLRATPSDAFAFEQPRPELLAAEGESWLVLPELYDQSQVLLVGLPQLTWQVDNPQVAEVRTAPETEDEVHVHEQSAVGAVFVDAKQAGETGLRVQAESGAAAELRMRVVSP